MWIQWKSLVCSAVQTTLKITLLMISNLMDFLLKSAEGVVKVDPSGLDGRKGTTPATRTN